MRRLWRRRAWLPRPVRWVLALAAAAGAVVSFAGGSGHDARARDGVGAVTGTSRAQHESQIVPGVQGSSAKLIAQGQTLFRQACASCHGWNAQGISNRGPNLHGVGALAADFYLRTGRMPLKEPQAQPRRAQSPFSGQQINALEAYVGHFGGPGVPAVNLADGDLSHGEDLFSVDCAGCHQIVAQGGITTRAFVPDLQSAKPIDVAEAVRIGPYIMPRFASQLTPHDINSLAKYVQYTKDPIDAGGWGIGHIGPIPEGAITWLLALFALVLVIRLIGERTTR
jgi:ubiquinol-cytochrome c reductase cytochrome c subunit